jgi:hypothetical protein
MIKWVVEEARFAIFSYSMLDIMMITGNIIDRCCGVMRRFAGVSLCLLLPLSLCGPINCNLHSL